MYDAACVAHSPQVILKSFFSLSHQTKKSMDDEQAETEKINWRHVIYSVRDLPGFRDNATLHEPPPVAPEGIDPSSWPKNWRKSKEKTEEQKKWNDYLNECTKHFERQKRVVYQYEHVWYLSLFAKLPNENN